MFSASGYNHESHKHSTATPSRRGRSPDHGNIRRPPGWGCRYVFAVIGKDAMPKAYRIRHWSEHFETNESRKRKGKLSWVAIPTAHDGRKFRRLTQHPKAVEIFAAWVLLLEIAAKCPCRGLLADDHNLPLSAGDCRDMTGFRQEIFEEAFKSLSDNNIGWLDVVDLPESAGICRNLPEVAHDSTNQPTVPTNQPTNQHDNENGGGFFSRIGISKLNLQSAVALAHWSDLKDSTGVKSMGAVIAHRIKSGAEPVKLTADAVVKAIKAGVVESVCLNGSGVVSVVGKKVQHNRAGLYVNDVLVIPSAKLMEAEYA